MWLTGDRRSTEIGNDNSCNLESLFRMLKPELLPLYEIVRINDGYFEILGSLVYHPGQYQIQLTTVYFSVNILNNPDITSTRHSDRDVEGLLRLHFQMQVNCQLFV